MMRYRAFIGGAAALVFILTVPCEGRGALAATREADDTVAVLDDVPLYERSNRWRCDVESKFLCFDHVCRRFSVADSVGEDGKKNILYWMELDFSEHTYARCDQNGCDLKEVGTSIAGAFTLIEPGDGAFMKIANGDGDFVDVATMGTGVATSFGVCVPEGP
ncbi:MAG: hypothetical protein HQ511_00070 [Rhodospirillales bacterium]|nr:hypothetical protein [Rhodospirillales bacterium]